MPLDFQESGFRVVAPDPAFRFAELPSYRALSGKNLKEMDIAWGEQPEGSPFRLLVLEIKGLGVWESKPDDPTKPREHLIQSCVAKATDTLMMLASAYVPTEWGKALEQELPTKLPPRPWGPPKLVFLIDIPEAGRELLLPVADKINALLKGRVEIYGIKNIAVIDFPTARKLGLPVARLEPVT